MQATIRERADADAIPRVEALDQAHQRLYACIGLGIDVDARLGPAFEQFLQPRDANPATAEGIRATAVPRERVARVCRFDRGDVEFRDRTAAIGDPIQARIVKRHRHPVGGEVRVGFEIAVSQGDSDLERRQRVLGRLAHTAAMRERDRPGMGQERMRTGA